MKNEVRIRIYCPWASYGHYCIEVKRKWMYFFSYWKTVDRFIGSYIGDWNPVLLKYNEACDFAIRAKHQHFLDEFYEIEKQKQMEWIKHTDRKRIELFPVNTEEL